MLSLSPRRSHQIRPGTLQRHPAAPAIQPQLVVKGKTNLPCFFTPLPTRYEYDTQLSLSLSSLSFRLTHRHSTATVIILMYKRNYYTNTVLCVTLSCVRVVNLINCNNTPSFILCLFYPTCVYVNPTPPVIFLLVIHRCCPTC